MEDTTVVVIVLQRCLGSSRVEEVVLEHLQHVGKLLIAFDWVEIYHNELATIVAKGIAWVTSLVQILQCRNEWNGWGLFSEMWRWWIGRQFRLRWSWYGEFECSWRIWDFGRSGLLTRWSDGDRALVRQWCSYGGEVDVRCSGNPTATYHGETAGAGD